MEILRFGLGIRFDLFDHPVGEERVSELLSEFSRALPAGVMADLMLFGGEYLMDPVRDRGVYTLVITNGSLKKMRTLYRTVNTDAVLRSMLCSVDPFLQNNVIRNFEGLEYFGKVDENGVLTGGVRSLSFSKKPLPRGKYSDKNTILIAPNSFKGTFSAYEVSRRIAAALRREMPLRGIVAVPVADGGDGTLEAAEVMLRGRKRTAQVTAPYGGSVRAAYYVCEGRTAFIESALASGIALCDQSALDPKLATSRGTGELILAALRDGLRDIRIGLGGSATNDCGLGAACALGFRFLDGEGEPVTLASDMGRVVSIDASGAAPQIKNASFTLMCDVKNPLVGDNGATYTFGPQKGADEHDIELLENGMQNMAAVITAYAGYDVASRPGAGAAGGMGAMFMALLGAVPVSGADALLDAAHFDRLLENASLVITGEGCIDGSTLGGKAVAVVAERAAAAGVPVALLGGKRGAGADEVEKKALVTVCCPDESGSLASLDAAALSLAKAVKNALKA